MVDDDPDWLSFRVSTENLNGAVQILLEHGGLGAYQALVLERSRRARYRAGAADSRDGPACQGHGGRCGASTYDAETVYVPLFHSGKILSNYFNPDVDELLDQAQTIMDPRKRLEQYHRINKLWIEDAAAMPLYQQLDLYGATKRMTWKARGDERIKGFDMAVKDGK